MLHTINIPRTIEPYTLNRWIGLHVNYSLEDLFKILNERSEWYYKDQKDNIYIGMDYN
jgi:hypothetical protein